jgi:membrane protein DedA with SNARE-associated domain
MNFARFTFYTLLGCVPWVFTLTYLGYLLAENWERVSSFLHYLDYVVALALAAGITHLFVRRRF